MSREGIILRVIVAIVALAITVVLLEFWGMTSGIIGHYLSERPTPKNTGEVTVKVLPPATPAPAEKPPPK